MMNNVKTSRAVYVDLCLCCCMCDYSLVPN
jgi:hypothetical protein